MSLTFNVKIVWAYRLAGTTSESVPVSDRAISSGFEWHREYRD
jgi:hypothetical protein